MISDLQLPALTQSVVELCRNVGEFMLAEQKKIRAANIEQKLHSELVSYVDAESERRLVAGLEMLLPDAGMLCEEGTGTPNKLGLQWIVDPLDGTTNYLYRIPLWCISIALAHGNDVLLGVVYDPVHGEAFTAWKGGGAYVNAVKIEVSTPRSLKESLVVMGFPYNTAGLLEKYMAILQQFTENSRGIRRLGSAAIDLCYVACGRCDVFYEAGLKPWDAAAGSLLVQEAGGRVTDFKAGDDFVFGGEILAAPPTVHAEALALLQQHLL